MKTIKTINKTNRTNKTHNTTKRVRERVMLNAPPIAVLLQLQDFAKRFGFEGVLTPADRRRSARFRADPRFAEAAASAVEGFASALGGDFDAVSLRTDIATLAGLSSVASAARTLARSIGDAILVRGAALAHTSDAVYAAVKAKSMTPNGKGLAAAEGELAALRKRGPRPRKPKAAPVPASQVQQAHIV